MELKRKFIKGVMNKDVDERLIPDGEYIDAVNVDVTNAEGSDAGTIRNVKGNSLVGDVSTAMSVAPTNPKTIGAIADEAETLIYWFVTADNVDGIYEYNENTGTVSRILESTSGQLNFNEDYYITGVNLIDGFLYWTDNLNPPRRVNISLVRTWGANSSKIDEYINVIVAPPMHAPKIDMQTATNQENNMEDKFLQFAYRYKYRDNQYSALSPFSATAFVAGDYELDFSSGNNEAMENANNQVKVTVQTGNQFVEKVQIVVRDTKNLNVYIVETIDKDLLGLEDYSDKEFIFKNNKTYSVLPADQVTRLFDNVPLTAKAQEIIDRRLVYGNYKQFYDIAGCAGDDDESGLIIDYVVGNIYEDISGDTGTPTFRSDRDYEIGLMYGDDYGRFTTVLTNHEATLSADTDQQSADKNTTYVPPTQSDKANSLTLSINNLAPCFATHYRVVIKESKKSYYNIFPILYYPDGVYRWFLINESDKNKFEVGDYIIFKSDGAGPTYSNEKYKILEFGAKPKDFLGGNETAGLYIKVRISGNQFLPSNLKVYTSNGAGAGLASKGAGIGLAGRNVLNDDNQSSYPVTSDVDPPIHYGSGSSAFAVVPSSLSYDLSDLRFYIEITQNNKFRYRLFEGNDVAALNPGWIEESAGVNEYNITSSEKWLKSNTPNGSLENIIKVKFQNPNGYTPGDYFVVNIRGNASGNWGDGLNLFGEVDIRSLYSSSGLIAASNLNGNSELQINTGALITIKIEEGPWIQEGGLQVVNSLSKTYPASSRTYMNIEEWYIEEGHWNDPSNIWAKNVLFRRGVSYEMIANTTTTCSPAPSVSSFYQATFPYPVRMMVKSTLNQNGAGASLCKNVELPFIRVEWKQEQLDAPLFAETEVKDVDDQIFYEVGKTYPIENRLHKVLWRYEDYTDVDTVLGSAYEGGAYSGKTIIGLADPVNDETGFNNEPHYFQAGNTVEIIPENLTGTFLQGFYEVLHVIDSYNIIIDHVFATTGSGPTVGGGVYLYNASDSVGGFEEADQTTTQPARIRLNFPQNENSVYNAYAFGNGLESDRIRDDFNETELQYSPRASTVIDDYKQEIKEASLCYSGIYKGDSSVNRLNEFNLSKANFKNLDREFGSIQKIFARDTDLLVLQENKTSKVLYGKNLLSDSVGGGQISSVPEVLGTQIAYAGDYGISFNPESFAEWGNAIWWCDERRGAVLQMTAGQIVDISKYGMKDFFRDMYRDNPRTQKLGVYDPYRHQYVLASNEDTSVACSLSLSKEGQTYPAYKPGGNTISTIPTFYVYSNTSWTTGIVYSAGSGWVTGLPASGYGDQAIYLGIADNNSGAQRTATITFTYCSGATSTFTITQARAGGGVAVISWVGHNGKFTKF